MFRKDPFSLLPVDTRTMPKPQRKEMIDTIKADLERLFPIGCGDHFLAPSRQALLLNVLSLWADLNTATAYRQVSEELLWFGKDAIYPQNGVGVPSNIS